MDRYFFIHWNMSGEDIISQTNKIIDRSINSNNAVLTSDFNNTTDFNSFLAKISNDLVECSIFHSMCSFLQFVSDSPEVRKASVVADSMLTDYINKLNMNKQIYTKITQFYVQADSQKILDDDDIWFIRKIVRTYKRNGINLSEDNRNLLQRTVTEISRVETHLLHNFHKDSKNLVGITNKESAGLPETFKNTLPIVDKNPLKYGIGVSNESFFRCYRYLDSGTVRKNLEFFHNNRSVDLLDNVARLLVLRHKRANLLNYANYSDYKIHYTLGKSCKKITEFLNDLLHKLDLRYSKEIDILMNFKRKKRPNAHQIHSSDIDYYVTKWTKMYGLDEQKISEYFPINHVVKMTLEIYQTVFQIKFVKVLETENSTTVHYHKDATLFKIFKDDKLIGHVYLDLFQRKGKTKQTRCFCLQPACMYPLEGGKYLIPIVSLIMSVPIPRSEPDKIHMTHSQVVPLFHEMGHVMHHVFGKTKYSSISGTNVELDFIETPAQVLENLCWDERVISKLSKHYLTGNSLPNRLITKISKVKNLSIAIKCKTLIMHSVYDQILHSSEKLVETCNELLKTPDKTVKLNSIIGVLTQAHEQVHNHVMRSGSNKSSKYIIKFNRGSVAPHTLDKIVLANDASYYRYIWSKVCADDMYSAKFAGWTDWADLSRIGTEFRDKVLSKGGSVEAVDIIKAYIGRHTDINGFMKYHKLKSSADKDAEENSFLFNTDKIALKDSTVNEDVIDATYNRTLSKISKLNNIDIKDIGYQEQEYTDMYPNRFSEIKVDEYDTTQAQSDSQSVKNKFEYVHNRLKQEVTEAVLNNLTEDTETVQKNISKIFIKQ